MSKKTKLTLREKEEVELKQREERRATNTAFILMFPALILAGMAGLLSVSFYGKLLVIALALYQFLMLKKFILDYYKK